MVALSWWLAPLFSLGDTRMSTSSPNNDARALYLSAINVTNIGKWKFRVKLRLRDGNIEENVDLVEHGPRWTPSRSCQVPDTGSISVCLKAGVTVVGIGLGKEEVTKDISIESINQEFLKFTSQNVPEGPSNSSNPYFSLSEDFTFDGHSVTMVLKFHPSHTSETVRQGLLRVKVAMENYSQLKSNKIMQSVDTALKFGVAASEVNPFSKAAFAIAKATYDLLREQVKYDEKVSGLIYGIERILPFFKTAEEVSYNDTGLLRKLIGEMNNLIVSTAEFTHEYVQQSFMKRLAKSAISPTDRRRMDGLQTELDNLKGEFDRVIELETLKAAKDVDTKLLLERLKPIDAGYDLKRKCMEGTRERLIEKIMTWAREPIDDAVSQKQDGTGSIVWLYGMPGIGKTSIANSICFRLHKEKKLGGSFFCRRDDPKLGNPEYVLPTLTCRLAEMWGPFRKLVAEELIKDPHITPKSTGDDMLSKVLKMLENHPLHPLVLVIDALDECGDDRTREAILRRIFDAAACVSWLKVIVTSRQERDITTFFQHPDRLSRYLPEDLSEDEKTHEDIRHFVKRRLSSIAAAEHLGKDWPPELLVNHVVIRARGLFIFVETLWRLIKDDSDPEEHLHQALEGSFGDALDDLYKLYSSILISRSRQDKIAFKAVMGAILVVASYRPLCAQTIAILLGRKASMVQTWVSNMSSLLYREGEQNGGIRVRHLSIIDFLTGASCPEEFRVDIQQAHEEMALACLKTMIGGLRFNICGLESSFVSNEEVEDMKERVKRNILDELQYSCIHWSNHLALSPYPAHPDTIEKLKEFLEDAQPLYWMEALSVMGEVSSGIRMLREVLQWAKGPKLPILEDVEDALRFLLAFRAAIARSAPHTYISGLSFTPKQSLLWKKTRKSFGKLLRVVKGQRERWTARPSTWKRHRDTVSSLSYSPDGQRVVSGSFDHTIRIWDAETGAPVGEPLKGHTSSVYSVAYSPDGRHVVSGSDDHTIRIWHVETGTPVGEPLRVHTNAVTSVTYSPDGRHIVSGSLDGTIRLWDAETRALVGWPLKRHTSSVSSVAFSPDGRHIVSGYGDSTIRIWNAETRTPVGEPLKGHTNSVSSVGYSPDGRHVVSGSHDHTIQIWDAKTRNPVSEPLKEHTASVKSVAYSPDSRYIISGSYDNTIRIWNAETRAPVGEPLKGHATAVYSVSYSPDGRHVISGAQDHTIRIWDAETGAPVGEPLKGHATQVKSVAYSADGRHVVSGAKDHTIRIWNAETGAPVGEPLEENASPVYSVAYSLDGRHVIAGSWDGMIRIWDAETRALVGWPLKGHTSPVSSVAYSPDGRHIVSGSWDNTIRIWDAETGAPDGEPLKGHTSSVYSVAYSPDGRHVVSGSEDRTIRIWDTETGAPVGGPLKGHTRLVTSVAYSPDGRHVASGSHDYTVRIWDAETGAPVGKPLMGHRGSIFSVAYSPDGRHVVSGSGIEMIEIWDVETGTLVGEPLKGHTGSILSIAYSPDGRHIVSGSYDRTIRIWDVTTGYPVGEPLEGHTNSVTSVAYSPDGRDVVPSPYEDTVRTWDANISADPLPIDFYPDHAGWVHHPNGGLLFWVPEDYRNGLTCPATLTIPTEGPARVVRLDVSGARFGDSWEEIKANDGK